MPVILKALLAAVTLFLLTSMGGAAAYGPMRPPYESQDRRGAPVGCAGRCHRSRTAWVLTYVGMGETMPWIWLLPVLAAIAGGVIVTGRACIPLPYEVENRPPTRAHRGVCGYFHCRPDRRPMPEGASYS